MNRRTKRLLPICAATTLTFVLALTVTTATPVHAAMSEPTFIATYEQNAQLEASLLQKATSMAGSSQSPSTLATTVAQLNQEIASLFVIQQQLAGQSSTIQSELTAHTLSAKLIVEQQQVQGTIEAEQSQLHLPSTTVLQKRQIHSQLAKQRGELNRLHHAIVQATRDEKHWLIHPYNGGLNQLDTSILHLQATAIAYTRDWITSISPVSP